ncbi:hypothetical protein [Devosia sp. 2618]|uniref:hypothetical protein n=1 Tax=Devosia sp. 2618 TaxID=3156454 RepID=UPI0033998116
MAISLPGERSLAAATPAHPLAAFTRWIAQANAARTRRVALKALLDLDQDRLADLGISRADVALAIQTPHRGATTLNAARARNAHS